MEQLLIDAQRILDECGENHLHPANNNRHPLHRQALKAIAELEEKIIQRSIGWLAQEGKITLDVVDRVETLALKE